MTHIPSAKSVAASVEAWLALFLLLFVPQAAAITAGQGPGERAAAGFVAGNDGRLYLFGGFNFGKEPASRECIYYGSPALQSPLLFFAFTW